MNKSTIREQFRKYRAVIADQAATIGQLEQQLSESNDEYHALEYRASERKHQLERELSSQRQQAESDRYAAEDLERRLKKQIADHEWGHRIGRY